MNLIYLTVIVVISLIQENSTQNETLQCKEIGEYVSLDSRNLFRIDQIINSFSVFIIRSVVRIVV